MNKQKEIFLDKDIIIRFARLKVFKEGMLSKQRELMQLIQENKVKAFISNNTPFAVINHLKYKYVREHSKINLIKREEELNKTAESKTKDWFETIFGKGEWELINLEMIDYEKATKDEKLWWEDAVQYQCACKMKNTNFITENLKDFKKTDLNVYSPRDIKM
ncbi:MAG: hypothetical protein ABH821_05195 [archaeon]